MKRVAALVAGLVVLLVAGGAAAHLDPEARTRTFVLDRTETALTLFARVPGPLVFARTIAARQAGASVPETPFLSTRTTTTGPITELDLSAVRADPEGFGALAAAGYELAVDGVPLQPSGVFAAVRAPVDLPPFSTPSLAQNAVRSEITADVETLFLGDALVDIAIHYGPVPATSTLSLVATLPELALPPGLYVDNHIVDAGPDGISSREIIGQLLSPVALPPPQAGDGWRFDLGQLVAEAQTGAVGLLLVAFLLGALHALEPGHAKTMMAAFIIAVDGTARHAVVLGLTAALSHSALVVVLGVLGLTLAPGLGAAVMPVVAILSGLAVLVVALWTLRPLLASRHAVVAPLAASVSSEGHAHGPTPHLHLDDDAHARAHAQEIRARFPDSRASLRQVAAFGLAGGLVPCGAAVTVLLLCLQLDRPGLGFGLLATFSAGLALTLIATALAASIGLRTAGARVPGFDAVVRAAPFVSTGLIAAIGIAMIVGGVAGLGADGGRAWF